MSSYGILDAFRRGGIPISRRLGAYAADFGRYIVRQPQMVAVPRDPAELAQTMRICFERSAPYVLRGAAHSSGGQTLTDDVVIDMTQLTGVVALEAASITVLGGTTWLTVAEALRKTRRPVSLTDNLVTTVGGTLSVGGVGDLALHEGLQIASVLGADWIAPDGTRRTLTRADEELGYLLAGRGQLGAFASVTLATLDRPHLLGGHVVTWSSLEPFVAAIRELRHARTFELVRSTLVWRADGSLAVRAVLASFTDREGELPPLGDKRLAALAPTTAEPIPGSDRHVVAAQPRTWDYVCPALELALPFDDHGLATLRALEHEIVTSGLVATLPDGVAIAPTRIMPDLPLAPTPHPSAGDCCMFIAIRPQLATRGDALRWLPVLRKLADLALDRGAKLYLMGIHVDRDDLLEKQFGAALPRFRALKSALDPHRLCNRWLL